MKIAHICLSNFYVDGVGYQENDLVREHVAAGHDVRVLASTETMTPEGRLIYTEPSQYFGQDGAAVQRLAYRRWLPQKVMRKLRMNKGVYASLAVFRPDAIMFHGTCGWELRTVARYVRENPNTLFYIDSHEDWNNSARNFLSREILHRRYYGPILRSVLGEAKSILCLSTECIDFVNDVYRVPRSRLEFYPLGGQPVSDDEYGKRRSVTRTRLGVSEGEVMIVQSGKQTRRKRLVESLRAFAEESSPSLRLFIAGTLHDEIKDEAEALILADSRVAFLGWRARDQLIDLLCAADVYLQPGTQSATMQNALCCRCAVVLDDVPAHRIYQQDNGWFVGDAAQLAMAFSEMTTADLFAMQARSERVAREMLDYSVLAKRVLR